MYNTSATPNPRVSQVQLKLEILLSPMILEVSYVQ